MRLQKYLNEETGTYEDMVSLIKSNCQPFLRDWQTNYKYNFLYSGRRSSDDFNIKTVRKDRRPKDTPLEIHKGIDDGFYKKFGVRARSNAVFCSFELSQTLGYGDAYMIFPIGKYVMISSDEVDDLYGKLRLLIRHIIDKDFNMDWYENGSEAGNIDKEKVKNGILDFLNQSNFKKYNFNLSEQMVTCKKYYMIQEIYEKKLREDLK